MSTKSLRRAIAVLGIVSAGAFLGGCAPAVPVDAAPYASDPHCASVMLAAPQTVGGLPIKKTTSQATAAYGDEYRVIARCGVEPPGPSEDPCVVVTTGTTTMGWLVTEVADDWVAVSFGHSPALEVTIPKARAQQAVGELLGEFSTSASRAPRNGLECR